MEEQNFANHMRVVPAFHFFVLPVLFLNFIYGIYFLVHTWLSFGAVVSLIVDAALVILALCARIFALAVQDRVIRLEMELRMAKLFPADLKARIGEFSVGQLIGLRFASDAELAGLAKSVLDEKLEDKKAIKQRIKVWRADHLRA